MTIITPSRSFDTFETPSDSIEGVRLMLENVTSLQSKVDGFSIVSVVLDYTPRNLLLRRDSFKKYIESYRGEDLSCEEMASKILSDLDQFLETKSIRVEVALRSTGLPAISAVASSSD